MNSSRFMQLLKHAPSQTNSLMYAGLKERKKEKKERRKKKGKKKKRQFIKSFFNGK